MKIGEVVLNRLVEKYNRTLIVPAETSLEQAPIAQAIQYIEDNFDNHFNWEELSESATNDEELIKILKACLINHEGHLRFEKLAARAAVLSLLKAIQITPVMGAGDPHPLVTERLNELQLYQKTLTFPGELPDPPLTSIDYTQFLLLVHEKFRSSGINKVLDAIVISCRDSTALEGLITYNETKQSLPFHTLTLDLDALDLSAPHASKLFLFNLKTMLLTMSDSNLSALRFINKKEQKLTPEMLMDIADFIKKNGIAIDVDLPEEAQSSAAQRTIDEAVSDHIRQRNIDALGKMPAKTGEASKGVARTVRTRPRLSGKLKVSVDVELQQEKQQEKQVELPEESGSKGAIGIALQSSDETIYDMEGFQKALREGKFDHSTKSYLVSSSRLDGTALWCNWSGALTTTEAMDPKTGIKISKSACEELLRHKDKFQYGLDFKNLPAGFILKKTAGDPAVVHFDEKLKLLSEFNPLQVQTAELPGEKPLTSNLFTKALNSLAAGNPIKEAWEILNTAEYDKKAHQLFKQLLPQMLLLNEEDLYNLLDLCYDTDRYGAVKSINMIKLQFLMENSAQLQKILKDHSYDENMSTTLNKLFPSKNKLLPYEMQDKAKAFIQNYKETMPVFAEHLLNQLIGEDTTTRDNIKHLIKEIPDINLNALLQLYVQLGEKGITELRTLVDADVTLFKKLNTEVFAKTKTYAPLLSKEFKDAMDAIKGFELDPNEKIWWNKLLEQHCEAQQNVNLVDLVHAFKAFKTELSELLVPFVFPPTCELIGVKSLPVALSRIISLLKHCKQENRQLQWEEVSKLDLSSTGIIHPISMSRFPWAFITPEMNVKAQYETGGDPIKSIKTKYLVPGRNEIASDTPEKMVENFFRHVAGSYQPNQLMPLELYRHAHTALVGSGLSPAVQQYLYPLIAAASTGDANVAHMNSLAEAKENVDALIKGIVLAPYRLDSVRITLLQVLDGLTVIPALPILSRLISVISSCASNPLNITRLKRASIDLELRVKDYGSSVYEGMKDYVDIDYAKSSLFFDHMDMLNKIDEKISNKVRDAPLLMAVLSAFHLTISDIDTIITTNFTDAAEHELCLKLPDSVIEKDKLYVEIKEGKLHYTVKTPSGEVVTGILESEQLEGIIFGDATLADKIVEFTRNGTKGSELIDQLRPFLSGILQTTSKRGHTYNDKSWREYQSTAIRLLKNVSTKSLRKLDANDFKFILEKVKEGYDKSWGLAALFKDLKLIDGQPLAAYFPTDYLETYEVPEIPLDVRTKLANNFAIEEHREKISRALKRFSAPGDNLHYNKLVDKIVAIYKPLSPIERNVFIAKLTASLGLYTDIKRLDDEDNAFVKLIDSIKSESPDEFISLIEAERHLFRNSTPEQKEEFFVPADGGERVIANLSQKAVLYMQKLSPAIRNIDNLAISQVDLVPRLLETLLKTPATQLNKDAVSAVVNDEQPFFERQEAALEKILAGIDKGSIIDFNEVDKTTNDFIANTSPDDHASCDKYRATIKKIGETPVNPGGIARLMFSSPLRKLKKYLDDPDTSDALSPEQKTRFETIAKRYPSLAVNKDLIGCLFKNAVLWQSLGKDHVLKEVSSRDLLDNDVKLDLFLDSLARDLDHLDDVKERTLRLQRELSTKKAELTRYPRVFVDLYKKINTITIENPGSEKQFLELYDRYLQHYSPTKHGELLKYLSDFVSTLKKSFSETTDKNLVLSLCLQFKGDKELQPEDLLKLLQEVEGVPAVNKATVLKIAVALINNGKDYNIESFKEFCKLVRESPRFAASLASMYERAPFPTIKQVIGWHTEAIKEDSTYVAKMVEFYKQYDISPCQREPKNGFHVITAQTQLKAFKGLEATSPIDLNAFYATTIEMRSKSTEELLGIFKTFKPTTPEDPSRSIDYDTLVAVAAELFHRSQGKDGNSMEINTTQYLAILTSLKTPGHVTSEIGTGEGKSRIMMISNACQYALGKTVDFVTSDVQLATRDFVSYQSYFDMIGAKTSMIYANTDPSQYQMGGINFSDPSNLSLFRNKARSMGREADVLDPKETNRALMLDEADKTYFDVANTRFNFSKEGDENIRGMEWVYPLLMTYFAKDDARELYYKDVVLSREKFLQFASANAGCTKTQLLRLKALSNAQIEQWQVSAITASQLKYKDDFIIEPDGRISIPSGTKMSSEAHLLFANRMSKGSKYSFGVHQCLHAGLNLAKKSLASVEDKLLREALEKCENPFYIPDEKQIVYSSTSKNLLDDYANSTLKAVTGTSGSPLERQEARKLYGLAGGKMHFIDVPRDKDIKRKDRALRLTGSSKQQFAALVEQVKEARRKNQPILIIAENDKESEILFNKLNQAFKDDKKIQHIHSLTSADDEKRKIDIAGEPGQITVSTDMIGRGTDISLKPGAKTHGLHVMVTYLPPSRDLAQIVGRSGRFGDEGETSLILDKPRLKQALGGKKTLTDGFYRNVEAYIEREQALMDRRNQCERLIKNTVGDFRKEITHLFFKEMLEGFNKKDREQLLPMWTAFSDKADKEWNARLPAIQSILLTEPIDLANIKHLLKEYKDKVQEIWVEMRSRARDVDVTDTEGKKPIEKLPDKIPDLMLTAPTENLLTNFAVEKDKEKIYGRYEAGQEGRAVKYAHWSIPLIASLKGYANLLPFVNYSDARRPFANMRAWSEGHGRLFPEFRASKNKGAMIAAGVFSLVGAAVGATLIATGILAPLGVAVLGLTSVVTSAIIFGAAGLVGGALVGGAGGAVIDAIVNRSTKPVQTTSDTAVAEPASAHTDDHIPGSYAAMSGALHRPDGTTALPRSLQARTEEGAVVPSPEEEAAAPAAQAVAPVVAPPSEVHSDDHAQPPTSGGP